MEKLRIAATAIGDEIHYGRENNGDWILMIGDGDSERRFGTVSFQGKAKRGQAWCAPDPAGLAAARLICDLWNSKAGDRE